MARRTGRSRSNRDHRPIELHLLLCKALRENSVTEELCWRTLFFFTALYQHEVPKGYHQIAVVSGGGGEASAVSVSLGLFQALLHQPSTGGFTGLFGRGVQLLEAQSPNSRLNIAFAVHAVREAGFYGPIRLYLYSSPYHCNGLLELRYKLPRISPFSFLNPNPIYDVIARPTFYPYPTCGVREIECLADAYLMGQALRLTWEDHRGISGIAGK